MIGGVGCVERKTYCVKHTVAVYAVRFTQYVLRSTFYALLMEL